MIPREILKKVHLIEIQTRSMVNNLFAGEYHSVFKGRGMEFAEVREYQAGDDVRTIDWNVTARSGRPFVKLFDEERELTVMLMVDLSRSGAFGTVRQTKREMAVELYALLAFSAIRNNDRVGLIGFTDRIEHFLPPKKGRKHVLRVIRELLYFQAEGIGTDIEGALQSLDRVTTRRCVAFLVSDFLAEGYETSLRILNKRHDIVAVPITDPREMELPSVGLIHLEDAETGERQVVDTYDPEVRRRFHRTAMERREQRDRLFRSAGVDSVEVWTDASYVEPLSRFFRMRARRFR